MVALFSVCDWLLCVLLVHFIILAIPKKRSDFPVALLGVISFPCAVDVYCSFPKNKDIVRSLWVPSVDAIVDRRNCFSYCGYLGVVDLLCFSGPLPECCPEV